MSATKSQSPARPPRHRGSSSISGSGPTNFAALEIGLPGTFQFNNAAIAVALFLLWLRRVRPGADAAGCEAAVRSGLRETRWPGRLEAIGRDPLTVVDVGHTPDGIRQSLASLKAIHGAKDWILVTGVSSDKQADEIVGALAPSFDTIVCTRAHHKGAEVAVIASAVREANPASRCAYRRDSRGGRAQ